MKNRIKLTESQLNRVIRESVRQTLSELNSTGGSFDPNERFDWCGQFKNGIAKVKLNGKYNFIDFNGNLLFPNTWFDWCSEFHNGVAEVELDRMYNRINTNGELLSPDRWFNGYDDLDRNGGSLQENRRYRRNKRLSEAQLNNVIRRAIRNSLR